MIDRFNVLRDRWIPVWIEDRRELVSLETVLTGGVESCAEVAHTRDEFRVFTHALASALVQALFEPKELSQLEERVATAMTVEEYRARVDAVADDFELLGEPGWMQWGERTEEDLTENLVHEFSETYRPALARARIVRGGMCPACACAGLFGFQSFAPAGGRGISPGVRGSPPLTTLVREDNLRKTVWANVLVRRGSYEVYPKDAARPWLLGPERRTQDNKGWEQYRKPANEIGLVEGLFWKPRSVRLAPSSDGECTICNERGPRVRVCAFRAGAKKEDGYFAHPLTPSKNDKDGRRTQHVPTDKPVWTGLADMLSIVRVGSAKAKDAGGLEALAAPVVSQWANLAVGRGVALYVFAYRFDNASLEGRYFQSFPALKSAGTKAFVDAVASIVKSAEETLNALLYALRRAYSDRQKSTASYWPQDARQEFWRRSEGAFWRAVAALDANEKPEPVVTEFAKIARRIFTTLTEPAALEAKHQRLVVLAQRQLNRALRAIASGESPTKRAAASGESATGGAR